MQTLFKLRVVLIAAALSCTRMQAWAADPNLSVQVESGRLKGVSAEGVRVFKNIPYAAPPVGPLRWAPPQPPLKWTGERAADAFGPACDMADWTKASPDTRIAGPGYTMWSNKVPPSPDSSEDCLSLNVWAPARAGKAPVMVFLPGAGGSGATPAWDGTAFARDGVVLVTLNHRQMTMGNFIHPALTKAAGPGQPSGNYQFQDPVAALKWVKRNIAAFGGDPGNVTLFGVSAGAAATLKIMTLPAAKGLFHKAIAQSAGPGWREGWSREQGERMGAYLATQAGLPGAQATAEQLRALPRGALPWTGFFMADGVFITETPSVEAAADRIVDVPLLIGWNSFDGSSLRYGYDEVIANTRPQVRAAYEGDGKTGQDLAYALYTDSHVAAPARWLAGRLAGGAPTYLYQFSYVRAENRGKVRGAAHGEELTYVFDSWAKFMPNVVLTDEDRAVTRLVHSCWVAFAKTGKPQCDGAPAWPRYAKADDRLMDLNAAPTVRQHLRKAQLDAQEAAMSDEHDLARKSADELLAKLVK